MKFISTIIAIIVIASALPAPAHAGPETKCYSYGNANGLAYCMKYMMRGGTINVSNTGNGALVTTLANYQPAPQPYVGTPYAVQSATPLAALGNITADMLAAAAWAYNWRHGYIGAQGIYGASYMMNYPW